MEILATIPIYTYPWFYNLILAIGMLIIIIGIISITYIEKVMNIIPLFIGLILIISGIIGITHTIKTIERTSYLDYTKYKVTINEEIGAQELLDKYEILSREGEIFTIKEIEVDE